MRSRAAGQVPRLDDAALLEIAQLRCAWQVTRGAAHTLNNALTAVVGLIDAPRDDGLLDSELERCTRVARALTAHHATQLGQADEAELGAVLRRVGPLLAQTLGRRYEVTSEAPADLLYVEADPARLELVTLLLAYDLAERAPGDARVQIGAAPGEKPDSACLQLDLTTPELPSSAVDAFLDPTGATGPGARLARKAILSAISACGGSLAVGALPGGMRAQALFPCIED